MIIRRNIIDPKTQTYKGTLDQYNFTSPEIGNLLEFLQDCTHKEKIWLVDSTDLLFDMPPKGYDTYIIGCFGELANLEYLNKLDKEYSTSKLVCLTSQDLTNCCSLENFQIFYIEHLHKLKTYFPQTDVKSLLDRNNLHSITSRRFEPQRYLFTAALLTLYPNSIYSLVRMFESKRFGFEQLALELENRFAYTISDPLIESKIKKLLDDEPKILPGHQWSIDNDAYLNSKCHWVTESIFLSLENAPTAYITEKTIKPIVAGCAFVLIGQSGVYHRLHQLGFQTNYDLFGIEFDHGHIDSIRIEKILALMKKLDDEFIFDNVSQLQQSVNYNYNHFYNQLASTCDQLNAQAKLDAVKYINS